MADTATTWADLLADEIRQLEARANGFDAATGIELFGLLRTIRGFETRVRHLALKADYRVAGMLPAHAP